MLPERGGKKAYTRDEILLTFLSNSYATFAENIKSYRFVYHCFNVQYFRAYYNILNENFYQNRKIT